MSVLRSAVFILFLLYYIFAVQLESKNTNRNVPLVFFEKRVHGLKNIENYSS